MPQGAVSVMMGLSGEWQFDAAAIPSRELVVHCWVVWVAFIGVESASKL
jgi:hypothetical protein